MSPAERPTAWVAIHMLSSSRTEGPSAVLVRNQLSNDVFACTIHPCLHFSVRASHLRP